MGIRKYKYLSVIVCLIFLTGVIGPMPVQAASDLENHWAKDTVNKWTAKGYINGYPDGTFRPDNGITRAEFISFANKAFGYKNTGIINFVDVPASHWAYREIQTGVAAGYINGYPDNNFRPDQAVTRQEAAAMFAQIKHLDDDTAAALTFSDAGNIGGWAMAAVGAVSKAQIMQGYPNGYFGPQIYMTRAEAVAAMDKAASYQKPNTPAVSSDYTLKETTLRSRIIEGDLIISNVLENKTVTLNDIIVKGAVKVQGGNVINANGCVFDTVELNKSNVTFNSDVNTSVNKLIGIKNGRINGWGYRDVVLENSTLSEMTIDADVKNVTMGTNVVLKLDEDADIDILEITSNAKNGEIIFTKGANVDEMIIRAKAEISGKGDIGTMVNYVADVRSSIKPDRLTLKDKGKTPYYTSNTSGNSDTLILDERDERFDADNQSYYNVSIEAKGVSLYDATVRNDLTITSAVGDGEVVLNNVQVEGNVYIYGGGKNSVIFRNCAIRGDIISDKNIDAASSSEAVGLYFKNNLSLRGNLVIYGATTIEADSNIQLNKVLVERSLSRELAISANINQLNVSGDCNVRILDKRIDNLYIPEESSALSLYLEYDGYIDTVENSSNYFSIYGNGTVNRLISDQAISVGNGVTINTNNAQRATVNSITTDDSREDLCIGDTVELFADVQGNLGNKQIRWSVSDNDYAAITTDNADGTRATLRITDQDRYNEKSITVTAKVSNSDDSGKQIKVSISAEGDVEADIELIGIDTDMYYYVGETYFAEAIIRVDDKIVDTLPRGYSIEWFCNSSAAEITRGQDRIRATIKAQEKGETDLSVRLMYDNRVVDDYTINSIEIRKKK